MANSVMFKLVFLVCASMVVSAPYVEAKIGCGQVYNYLSPCLSYIVSGGSVGPSCCRGIKSLNALARSKPDRQGACNCLKSLARSTRGLNTANAASLPGKCRVNIGYPISFSVDCSKVK